MTQVDSGTTTGELGALSEVDLRGTWPHEASAFVVLDTTHAADPGKGYEVKAAEWRAKLLWDTSGPLAPARID